MIEALNEKNSSGNKINKNNSSGGIGNDNDNDNDNDTRRMFSGYP